MEKKKRGEPIVQLAVYDYANAIIADRVGWTSCACRTAGGMVLFGHEAGAATEQKRKKVTIPMLMEKKKRGEPIVQLAVYDYANAIIADRVG
ncbi:hypothetical protein F1714_12035, partial [Streptococcus pneumoniae]